MASDAYRPRALFDGFNIEVLATTEGALDDLAAHRARRAVFRAHGATASDHGHPNAATSNLSESAAKALLAKIISGDFSAQDAETFRGQMLAEIARMSLEDGLTLQIHPGSRRNHGADVFAQFGRCQRHSGSLPRGKRTASQMGERRNSRQVGARVRTEIHHSRAVVIVHHLH